jgi:2-polyprenyl-3-methyl-5-hydroxy-6-metoxy-1,4-benzoquinol methylase
MSETRETYQYNQEYPYLKEMQRLSLRPAYDAWITYRAFNEIYIPLGLKLDQTLLDVGTCTGNLGHSLNRGGIRTIGTDINLAALKMGQEIFNARQPQNLSTQATSNALPFIDKSFDAVVSQDLFEHLPNMLMAEATLNEMDRVNKGTRMVQKITVLEDKEWIDADESHRLKLPAAEWEDWFAYQGWMTLAPTTKSFPFWSRKKIGIGQMHGYFLLEKFDSSAK